MVTGFIFIFIFIFILCFLKNNQEYIQPNLSTQIGCFYFHCSHFFLIFFIYILLCMMKELKDAFETKKGKQLAAAVGGILTRLSERQRLQIVDLYSRTYGKNLKRLISEKFGGDTANLLIELCRSSAALSTI